MKSKWILTIFTLAISTGIYAQGGFEVLSAKGENTVQKNGKYLPLGPGMQLPPNAKLMLGDGGAVELSNSAGKTIGINTPGIYTMNDVAGDFKADQSSIAQRYLAYVFQEMKGETESTNSNMSITGSVERSLNHNGINLFSPESTYIMQKETTIKWESETSSNAYKVMVMNLFDETVMEETVATDKVTLDLSKVEFEEDALYKLVVVDSKNPSLKSGELILRVPSNTHRAKFKRDLAEIEKGKSDESPLYFALLAKFYKVNGLYVDAVDHFEKALAMAPESELIRMEYHAFLEQAGVKEKEQ